MSSLPETAPDRESRGGPLVTLAIILLSGVLASVGRAPESPDYAAILAFRPLLFAFVRARVAPILEPEDVTAEILMQAAASWSRFAPAVGEDRTAALHRWIWAIARNTVLYRMRQARAEFIGLRDYAHSHTKRSPGSAFEAEARDLLSVLRDSTAPENWRVLFGQFEGYSVAELAEREGVSVAQVHWRIRVARQDFETALARIAMLEARRGPR